MAFTTVALTVHDVICSILDPSTPSTGALRNTCLIMICVASNFFRSQSWIDSAILSWLLILYVMTGYWFMWSDDVYCPLHTLLLLVFMLSGFKLFVSITMLLILYICVLVCICNISLNDDFHSHFDWNSNAQVFVIVFVGLCSHLSTGLVVWNLDRALENDVSNYLADISLVLSGHENVEEWERVVFPSMERVHRNSHDCKRLKTRTATGSPASVVSAHSTLDELTARAHNSLGDGGSVQLLWPMWHFGGNFGSFGCAASAPASKDTQQLDHCFRLCLRSQCTLPDSLPVSGPPKRRQARDALRSWWGRVRNAEWVSPNISLVRVPSATFPIVTMPPVSRFTKRFMNLDLEAHFWYWMRHCYASHVSDSVGTFRGLLVVKNVGLIRGFDLVSIRVCHQRADQFPRPFNCCWSLTTIKAPLQQPTPVLVGLDRDFGRNLVHFPPVDVAAADRACRTHDCESNVCRQTGGRLYHSRKHSPTVAAAGGGVNRIPTHVPRRFLPQLFHWEIIVAQFFC
ncbi:MAG: hypothetical protein KVP17_002340 [Porospora cf. gigantea B]|uniref:uncharacterized protein n=2 Tax=Porospora cf. gigantea B TaxID=2853592 RepID=UPI003571ADD7|nr:MAG: hypothetical protein KVP17_002340 [Porospora cf. gigantea B]